MSRFLTAVLCVLAMAAGMLAASAAAAQDAHFGIQVGAYKSEADAKQETSALKAKGMDAYYHLEDAGAKGKWYRVYVGRYASRAEAQKQAPAVAQKTNVKDVTIRQFSPATSPAARAAAEKPAVSAAPVPAPAAPKRAAAAPMIVTSAVDSFEVVVDLSGSMHEPFDCKGITKQEAQLTILRKMNAKIPNASYQAALREFSYKQPFSRKDYTTLKYGPKAYDRQAYQAAIAAIVPTHNITPLGWAVIASGDDLAAMPGAKALIVMSDFQENVDFGFPLAQARALSGKFGDSLNIYTIYCGNMDAEIKLAQDMAAATKKGKAYSACRLMEDEAYFDQMIADIFGAKSAPATCTDSDGDSVCDNVDKCPNTPKGAPVDERGCWIAAYSQFFDFNKAVVKPEFLPRIKHAAEIIRQNPGIRITIEGHTDNIGGEAYNQKLGLQRAEAVRDKLVEYGVEKNRLEVKSYGKSRPIADNKTEDGRAKNRRVEFQVGDPGKTR